MKVEDAVGEKTYKRIQSLPKNDKGEVPVAVENFQTPENTMGSRWVWGEPFTPQPGVSAGVILDSLRDTTAHMFPAGDWRDVRRHLPFLHWVVHNVSRTDPNKPDGLYPPNIVEIGVRQGPSSLAMLLALRDLPCHGMLHSYDIDEYEPTIAYHVAQMVDVHHFWDLRIQDGREGAGEWTKKFGRPTPVDFLFIDGNHAAPYPWEDFCAWEGHIRRGGLVAFHDTNIEPWRDEHGAVEAIERIKADRPNWQVFTGFPWSYGIGLAHKLGEA